MSTPGYFSPLVERAWRFHLRPAAARDRPVVVSGGFERCMDGYRVERERFPFLTVEMVVRGTGEVCFGHETRPLGPGTILCYGPGVPHRIAAVRGTMDKWFVACLPDPATALFRRHGIRPGSVARVRLGTLIEALWPELAETALGDRPDRAGTCSLLAELLIRKMADERVPDDDDPAEAAAATFHRCRDILERGFVEIGSLREAAARCHVGPEYLCRLFRRFGRESPYRFLQHLRMNHAADLMRNSSRPVKAVAAELGITDPFHFSRLFKRVMGVSPAAFRRSGRE